MSAPALRIALLQLAGAGYDREQSLARGLAACREAAARGAHLALFPELWSTGYAFPGGDLEQWREQAITRDDPWVRAFADVAAELGMAVAVTYLESTAAGPRNTVTLFGSGGAEALTYAKVHTCSFDLPEHALVPGEAYPVARLETGAGPVDVGAMICFDREFPEAARVLSLGGAELILVPNACELEANRLGQVRARAFENMAAVAVANYAAPSGQTRSGRGERPLHRGRPDRLRRGRPQPRHPRLRGRGGGGGLRRRARPRGPARLARARGVGRQVPPAGDLRRAGRARGGRRRLTATASWARAPGLPGHPSGHCAFG